VAFVAHGPCQRPYESQSSVWSGPQKQGVNRAGRWLNSQAPQPPRPAFSFVFPGRLDPSVSADLEIPRVVSGADLARQPNRDPSPIWSRLPVLEALELHTWLTSSDAARQPNRDPSPVWSRMPVLEALELQHWSVPPSDRQVWRDTRSDFYTPQIVIPPTPLPIELLKVVTGADSQAPHPGLSWTKGVQIPAEAVGGLPLELRRFPTGDPYQRHATEAIAYWNVQRRALKRAGRWVTSQPRQPRIVPESIYRAFSLVNIPAVQLPVQLRKFVQGQPYMPHATESSWSRGVKIPNPSQSVGGAVSRGWTPIVICKVRYPEASIVQHGQIPTNADLYSVRRAFASFVAFHNQFSEGSALYSREDIATPFPVLPIELQLFVTTVDPQPVPRPEPALWIPQLQAAVVLAEELKQFVLGQDPVVLRQVFSWVAGVQIPNPLPPLPIELQQFVVVGAESFATQRGQSMLTYRYLPDRVLLPIELLNFTQGDPRQPSFVPHSQFVSRKVDELTAMPIELRHYVETAFQRYRSHYLILRGTFEPVPVSDVITTYKYFRGYTIIEKKTRLDS